jgi:low affinity Fe/Cu permease
MMNFSRVARSTSEVVGSPIAFVIAVGIIVLWAALGPVLKFSETWQLVINTTTTISTFLMVFILQHTQNHDTRALHMKLDELIHALPGPRDEVAGIERKE